MKLIPTSVRMPDQLYRKSQKLAKVLGISFNCLVNQLIRNFLKDPDAMIDKIADTFTKK